MKRLLITALAALQAMSFQAQATDGQRTCLQAWKSVFVEGDITGREVVQNTAIVGGGVAAASLGIKASSSVGTAAKIALLLATVGGIVAISNLEADEQMRAIVTIKKEALVGGGQALAALAERMIEEGKASDEKQVEEAINSITDNELKFLCTRDNNPVIFGRYVELLIGKMQR